jgi:hypothetical protein
VNAGPGGKRICPLYLVARDDRLTAHSAYARGYARAKTDVPSFKAFRTLDANSPQSTQRKQEAAYSGSRERVHGGQQKIPFGSLELNACLMTQNKMSFARRSYSSFALI